MEDKRLIEAVLSGDRDAFGPLMDRYYAMVYRLCLNMTGNVPDAEELAHDSFVEAYLKLGQLREPERFGGWLKTLALNLCRMWYRRNQQRALELSEETVAAVEEDVEDPDIYARMSYGLSTLPAPHRLVLVLHYYEGLSYDEVATFLEVPKGTVMSRLHRARQALKEVMQQMNEHEIPDVPDDRFKEVVQAEIEVLLRMFPNEPSAPERLGVVLRKSPERLAELVTDAEAREMLRSLAILLPHLGVEAIDTVLDCRFSSDANKASRTSELLQNYAARCGTVGQRDGMPDMSSRDTYIMLERILAHGADDKAKAEALLEMMEACEDPCPALLFTNALMGYEDAAFPLLMERFLSTQTGDKAKQSPRVLHALVRTGERFGRAALELIGSGMPEKQSSGLLGAEAIARSLCPPWLNGASREQWLNDLRTREKWPPLRTEEVGADLLGDLTGKAAEIAASGSVELRAQAVRVLGYMKAGEYSDLITERLKDDDLATRMSAIFALSEIGNPASAEALIDRAQNSRGSEQAAALTALGRLQVTQAEHILVEMTRSGEEQVREAAVVALGEMGSVSARVVLQELMRGTDTRMQKTAAKAIFGGVPQRKRELSEVEKKLAEKRRKVQPVAPISPDAALRFGLTELRNYDERDITERIAKVCSDYCATRRYMVELGLMTRSNGIYEFTETGERAWRVEQWVRERYLERQLRVEC